VCIYFIITANAIVIIMYKKLSDIFNVIVGSRFVQKSRSDTDPDNQVQLRLNVLQYVSIWNLKLGDLGTLLTGPA